MWKRYRASRRLRQNKDEALRQMSARTISTEAYLYKPNAAIRWQSQPRRGRNATRWPFRIIAGSSADLNIDNFIAPVFDCDIIQ